MAISDDELFDLIAQEALIERGRLTRAATLAEIGIDSVDLVSVVFAVEEKYGVSVPEDAFAGAGDLGAFVDVLKPLLEAGPST